MKLKQLGLAIGLTLSIAAFHSSAQAQVITQSKIGKATLMSCSDSEATLRAKGAVGVQLGSSSIYIGYRQVSKLNKDPILMRFANGRLSWCRTDLEVTNDDSTGYGLIWDGGNNLYGVFSSTGTQGMPSQDFRRFATAGWLTSYGMGGGAKVAVIARINPTTGMPTNATFLSAVLPDGRSNSLQITGLSWSNNALAVQANSWFVPRNVLKRGMTCGTGSPYVQTIQFNSILSSAIYSRADRCR